MKTCINMKRAVCAGVSLVALVSVHGIAQAQEASQTYSAGEIIVTAQKREQSINDVGLTIQAASADALADRGIQDVGDLSKLVAGFTATSSTFATPVYTLRGIGLYDSTIGAAPAVAIYTDEVSRNFPVMSDALSMDIERVEVLKGPQGTLFGQSSTGGAINYIMAKPTDSFEAGADMSYERFNRAEVSGFVSGPLSDALRGRLAVKGVSGGAWQYNLAKSQLANSGETNGDERKIMGRASLDWTPSDAIRIQATLTGARDRSDTQAPQYAGSFYNVYSTASLAAANANPATANPYGYVDNVLYAQLTTPGSPGYLSSFVGTQGTAERRLNGTDSLNAFGGPRPWAQFTLQEATQFILGTPVVKTPRAGSWSPGFLRSNKDWYWQGTLRADFDLSDQITLTSITAYAEKKTDRTVDLDASGASAYDILSYGKIEAFNQEIRLTGDMDRLNWLVGVNYDHLKTSDNNAYILYDYLTSNPFDWANTGIGPGQDTLNNFDTKAETYAVFGNVEYEIAENLTVSGGLRYTKNKQDATYCYNDPAADDTFSSWQGVNRIFELINGGAVNLNPGDCFVVGDGQPGYPVGVSIIDPLKLSQSEDNWSWRAGLNYKFDNGGLVYGTVSQGYKAGVFSNIGSTIISQYIPATQEKLVSYEGGFKMPFANGRLRLNGSAFYYDYSDKQVRAKIQDTIWGLLERLINVPKSRVWGIEGELFAQPIDGLTFSGSATYIDSKVTKSFSQFVGLDVYNNMGFTGDFKGSELPYTPNFMANADIQYEWQMGDVRPFVGGTFVYQGSSNATFKNDILRADFFEIPSYETVDLRAGISVNDDQWKFTVYGRNVFNKYYITSPIYYGDAYFNMVGRPAVYGASVSFRY